MMIPLCFLSFKKMGMHTKIVFLWQIIRNLDDLGYTRKLMTMGAIFNKKNPSAWILGDLTPGY